jgi:hypothetical protein
LWAFDLEVIALDGDTAEPAGRFEVFGSHGQGHHHHGGTVHFTLPLSTAMRKLHVSGRLDLQRALSLRLTLAPRSDAPTAAHVTNAHSEAVLQVTSFGADIY